jgi:molecular chaperone DnaJ
MTCQACRGAGKTISCTKCGGSRHEKKSKTINIRIPVAITHMSVMRVAGGGNFNYGTGRFGDLFIRIIVRSDSRFRRDTLHIFSTISVDYLDCILGGEVEAETIHGKVKIEIPPYTKNGAVIVSPNNGIKLVDKNMYGNHYFAVNISIPDFIPEKDKKTLRKIRGRNKN